MAVGAEGTAVDHAGTTTTTEGDTSTAMPRLKRMILPVRCPQDLDGHRLRQILGSNPHGAVVAEGHQQDGMAAPDMEPQCLHIVHDKTLEWSHLRTSQQVVKCALREDGRHPTAQYPGQGPHLQQGVHLQAMGISR